MCMLWCMVFIMPQVWKDTASLREMSATWSVFRELLLFNYTVTHWPTSSYACTHTKAGHPTGEHGSHPVKDRLVTPVGTVRHGKVVITHRNALTPLSPWVSTAHVSQVSLNQGSFFTTAGVQCVCACVMFERERSACNFKACEWDWECVTGEIKSLINQTVLWWVHLQKTHCHHRATQRKQAIHLLNMPECSKTTSVFQTAITYTHAWQHHLCTLTSRAWGLRW